MKKVRTILGVISILVVPHCPSPQAQTAPRLALDASKPFVYIEFDHTGPREALGSDEIAQGLWLHLVNNSVFPIIVRAHTALTDADMTILEDVITPQMRVIPKSGLPDYGPMPRGYATGWDVASLLTVRPGKGVLFSVPVNHVAPGWFLQVPFQFDLAPPEHGAAQPVCYAGFAWDDIPEKFRWGGKAVLPKPEPSKRPLSLLQGSSHGRGARFLLRWMEQERVPLDKRRVAEPM